MISKIVYSKEYSDNLREKYRKDPGLLERVLYAMGLLEAITCVGMPFIFKGGSSLMLMFDHPLRLSTDIDIMVDPGIDVDHYIEEAAKIFPFLSYTEDRRIGKNKIEKRHFKFIYHSPLRNELFYILLDVVFAESVYPATEQREIKNDLLVTEGAPVTVNIPSPDCILGEKLTAFAPHTTGVPFGIDKEMEIIKQLFDIASLTDIAENFSNTAETFNKVVKEEIGYRDRDITREDVLEDIIESAACIIGKGFNAPDEFPYFLKGIQKIGTHVLAPHYQLAVSSEQACRVMNIASCILTNNIFTQIIDPIPYMQQDFSKSKYRRLSYMKRQDPVSYAYLAESILMLNEIHRFDSASDQR